MRNLIGRQIGPYVIKDVLGNGGMAVVYRAYQESLNRDVAIKVLHTSLAEDETFVARFKREAMAAAALRHPNILKIHDAGTWEGRHYIVMDYVSGGTLTDLLRTGAMPIDKAVEMAAQVADALGYAHGRGIVHRDMKPSNILLDDEGRPLLSDFGIAHMMGSEHKLTQTGTSLGTPEYMSPEQTEGLPLDGRTDIYSMGVVLYQMVTGVLPFQANTPISILYKVVHEPPPPPHQYNPQVPPYVESIILRAMAKNPADRFAFAQEMAQALRQRRVVPGATATAPQPVISAAAAAPAYASAPAPAPTAAVRQPPPAAVAAPRQGKGRGLLVALLAVIMVALVGAGVYLVGGYLLPPANNAQVAALATQAPTPAPAVATLVPSPAASSTAAFPTATPSRTQEAASPTPAPSATTLPATAPPTATATPTTLPTPSPAPSATRTATPLPAATATAPPSGGGSGGGSGSSTAGLLLDFENFGSWKLGDQQYGTLQQSGEQKHGGSSSAKLTYNIPAVKDNYVVFLRQPPLAISGQPSALTLWVYGDGSNHFLNAWVGDNQGEVRQFTFGRIQHKNTWQAMTAPLDPKAAWPQAHISGPDNGALDYPITLQAFVLDAVPDGGGPFSGVIYLDDLSAGGAAAAVSSGGSGAAAGGAATAAPTAAQSSASASLSGRIVFTQGRAGGTDIMALDVAGGNTWMAANWGVQPDLYADGRVVLNGLNGGKDNLRLVTLGAGGDTQMSNHPEDSYPSWSPSGKSVVYSSSAAGGQWRLYVLPDSARSQEPQPLAFNREAVLGQYPTWLGNWRVAYAGCGYQWAQGSLCGLWTINSDGSGGPARLTEDAGDHPTDAYGGNLLFSRNSGGNWDVYVIPEGGGAARNLTNSPSQDAAATFSPDGRSIAFISNRDGWGIWVMNSDGGNPRKLLAVPGGFGNWADERLSWGP